MPLRAAVFDFDGVIVDSEPLHFRSLRDALLADGVTITEEEYLGSLLAYDDWGAIRRALEHRREPAEPDRLARLAARKTDLFAELIPDIPLFPGAAELIRELSAEVPLAIASGARHEEVDGILRGVGLREAFAVIVGAEDVPRTKPDPAPYLEAVRRLAARLGDLPPNDCLAVEDSMPGIASALAAGMRVVGVANSYPADELQDAHRVVDSLAGLTVDGLRDLFGD